MLISCEETDGDENNECVCLNCDADFMLDWVKSVSFLSHFIGTI